ncbi:hypothetical protein [Microbulbifer sp. YPW1]|uniref:hypothetical protein n=1 Tax=Microbulbifer sp. YPW1 TaxID=2745199 RepID=UPI001599E303|nr:hypothetical protein [Microbulbifer sp. YPW1]QKX15829.1 hypothetical protein HUW35_01760 [Microbulbifer sp. YPW1]
MIFDEYISVGDNCEAGLNFWRIGYDYSSVFRFGRSDLLENMRLLEADFDGVYESVSPVSNDMVRCDKYNVSWHSSIKSALEGGERKVLCSEIEAEKYRIEEKNKLMHLVKKWHQDLASNKKIAFFYKSNSEPDVASLQRFLDYLQYKCPSLSFKLIVVLTEEQRSLLGDRLGALGGEVEVEVVKFFAPYHDAYSYSADCWDKIFSKYPVSSERLTRTPLGKFARVSL